MSTETAYLTDAVLARGNLRVVVGVRVLRVVFDTKGRKPRAIGVEMQKASPFTVVPKDGMRNTNNFDISRGRMN